MPRSKGSTTFTTPKESTNQWKLSIPGVNIIELLELEDYLGEIRQHLTRVIIIVVIVAQIRTALSSLKPVAIQGLESVNYYIKTFLTKDPSIVYVAAAVAIRRTMIVYANADDASSLILDFKDLTENLSGPVTTRGGLSAALGSEAKMRAYRRGTMAQVNGQMQSIPIHYPRRIATGIETVSIENIAQHLPFNTEGLDLNAILVSISEQILNGSDKDVREFNDFPSVDEGQIKMETRLPIKRIAPQLPDISKIPSNITNLPQWKQLAIIQLKNTAQRGSKP